MAHILTRVGALFVAVVGISACADETVLPDTQLRASGSSILQDDDGFGLGSGGVTGLPPGDTVDPEAEEECDDGFGLGSGGRETECPTVPTS